MVGIHPSWYIHPPYHPGYTCSPPVPAHGYTADHGWETASRA